jgi:hypothetical protein
MDPLSITFDLPPSTRRSHCQSFADDEASCSSTAFAEFNLDQRLQSLETLQQHPRHIRIDIEINLLDAGSAKNPFILTQLPLHDLDIVDSLSVTLTRSV